jgi:ADP-ribose pyrophosphatase YjhB (NUDIX family)
MSYLWPTLEQGRRRRGMHPDLVAIYASRADAPLEMWHALFEQAEHEIGILVYAGVFLHELWPDFNRLLKAKAKGGCRVRVLLGDPFSAAVARRGQEEKYGHGIESRCRQALMHYAPLTGLPGVEINQHDTTLYNSIYMGDEQMIVNTHRFGMNAYATPVCCICGAQPKAVSSTATPRASRTFGGCRAQPRRSEVLARHEYYDDPNAPRPNSLVVATSAVVVNGDGRILMQRRADSGNWALPGGGMEMEESLTESVIREVKEESGYDVEVTGLVGTYTDPRHIIAYGNGEVRRQFNICYTARIIGGDLMISSESTEIRFVDPAELSELPIHPTQALRLRHYLENRGRPYLG